MRLRTEKRSFWVKIEIGGAVCDLEVSPLSSKEVREMVQKHTKSRFNRGQKGDETDELALRLERFDKTVLNWEGIFDVENRPLECNGENKRKIAEFNHDFVLAVFEATEDINITLNTETQEEQKK